MMQTGSIVMILSCLPFFVLQIPPCSMTICQLPEKSLENLDRLLLPFFKRYDTDNSGLLDASELAFVLRDLGEKNITETRNIQKIFDDVS